MKNDILEITWKDGQAKMQIYMPKFFPCSEKNFKKLMKTVRMDLEEKKLRHWIGAHFVLYRDEASKESEGFARAHLRYKQEIADLTEQIESGKMPNGVRLASSQVKGHKARLKDLQKFARDSKRSAKKAMERADWFRVHLKEVLDVF